MKTDSPTRILVWDLPTRVFHWALAASFAGAFLTSESELYRDVHVTCGYTLFGLIIFRVLWGLIGSRYARFASFPMRPGAVARYLKSLGSSKPEHHVGHNPAGSYAVVALLLLAAGTAISGYATYNEWIDEDLHEVLANTMLLLVGVHVVAVVASSWLHRENLVAAMVTGYKEGRPEDGVRGRWWAVGVGLVAAAAAGFAALAQAAPDTATATDATAKAHHSERGHHADDNDD